MIDSDEQPPFRVEPNGEGFKVVDWEGKTVVNSTTLGNAEQYAAMLGDAYRRGYKAGFRKAHRTRGQKNT
jgi:hypothetical protein